MIVSFDNLGIDSKLIEGLAKANISIPTDIQQKAIPFALQNKDIIGQSQTGSGKTLAYLLPIFQRVDTSKRELQALILAPTHELVMQIENQIKILAHNSEIAVTSAAIIGEVNVKRQIEKLREKPHIIVGSTGRIFELIKDKKINAQTIKTIVIDEGDRLLDHDNLTSVKNVIKTTLKDRQLMVFSATISENTLNTAKELMKEEPCIIKIENENPVSSTIEHMYFITEQRDKIEVLRKLIASINPKKAMIFINKSDDIQLTTSKLQYHHINAYGIFGSADKEERKKALEGFRNGKYQLLVASDLAARGLDIEGVTHIINLDLPPDPKEFLHRAGRTGRVGKVGTTISIITQKEKTLLNSYERLFNIKIQAKKIYKGKISNSFQENQLTEK
jgi:ATP-dependent RNA helicase DeaD